MNFRKGRNGMIIEEKHIKLRDGRDALLRSPSADDAEEMLGFLKKVSTETDFLLRGADDPPMPIEDEKKYLEKNRGSENDLMICCFIDDNGTYHLAGSCGLSFGARKKIRHRVSLGISVLREFWSLGIGTALMEEADRAAREKRALQIELEFAEGNSRARALYERCGFRLAGVHPDAFLMPDGTLKNEYLMIKKL